jgi:hypothetical protein
VPQEPQDPPQQPPPPPLPKSTAWDDSLPPPTWAKLETSTLVLVDSQAGHIWALSRSANLVSTSKVFEQLSHRYSYMGISMNDSRARIHWPGGADVVWGVRDEGGTSTGPERI